MINDTQQEGHQELRSRTGGDQAPECDLDRLWQRASSCTVRHGIDHVTRIKSLCGMAAVDPMYHVHALCKCVRVVLNDLWIEADGCRL